MQVKPDFTVPMRDMIEEGISRPIEVFALGADLRWDDSGDLIDASFGDDLSKKHTAQRLRTALQPRNQFTVELVQRAVEHLVAIRLNEQPNAALIIFAKDKFHAEQIAQIVRRDQKITPVIVHIGVQDAGDKIEQFKNSVDEVIIACRMVSEGVNIKRARVGLYLTNVTSPLAFEQCITRLCRKERFEQSEPSYFYTPADPRIIALVNDLENVKLVTLSSDDPVPNPNVGSGSSGSTSGFLPISAVPTETIGMYRGDSATEAELKLAATFRTQHPDVAAGIPDTQLGKIAATYVKPDELENLTFAPQPVAPETYDEKSKRLKLRANKLANRLAYRKSVNPKDVHSDWLQQGNRKHAVADLSDLEAKISWLEQELDQHPNQALNPFGVRTFTTVGDQNV
ncbi:MAG: helicase-related protein [Paracoccaceae bacterium]|nr:helicase-related protein [Paracoccaceae bacterium]